MAKRTRPRPRPDAELLAALALLEQRRLPYATLIAGIVARALARFPPAPGRPIVEIGAGAGQLSTWLPGELAARTIHSDPSPAALRLLRGNAPGATAAAALAQRLPVAGGALGGALGLCVFDAIHAGGAEAAVVAELGRALAPGARFLHFLDMATLLETPFRKLAASGLIPIPNLFGDPGDHEWPLDIVLIKRDWLAGLQRLARGSGHALPAAFGRTFDAFLGERFDAQGATALFKAIASSGPRRQELHALLVSACRLAIDRGHPAFEPLPFHSGKYLASVLEASFRDAGTFDVEHARIETAASWGPAAPADGAVRYRSLCLGHQRISDELPRRLLDESARTPPSGGGDALVEAGVFVFVARRR